MNVPIQSGNEQNSEGRVLARLKEKLNYAMGINRTRLLILVERWVLKSNGGVMDNRASHRKNNALRRLNDDEITFKKFLEYLDIVGYSECEITFKGKHRSGKVYTATESFVFVDANPGKRKDFEDNIKEVMEADEIEVEFEGKHKSGNVITAQQDVYDLITKANNIIKQKDEESFKEKEIENGSK